MTVSLVPVFPLCASLIMVVRLLALHGKGTSASIMRAQIKPIVDALRDVVQVEYLQGHEACAPYSGIESLFPSQKYWAWYNTPTTESLARAHERIRHSLTSGAVCTPSQQSLVTGSIQRMAIPETPPDTPSFDSSTSKIATGAWASTQIDLETPVWTPQELSSESPFDGVICFSQGGAALTGLLLSMADHLPIKFAIVICSGRPFDNSFHRVDPGSVPRIRLPSIHVHGRLDPGLAESRHLYSMYHEDNKVLIELDLGHCPPRRSADVDKVAAAVRAMIVELSL